jgi:hypothetical protein
MKKILYLVIGLIIALLGAWLVYIWWPFFVVIFKGLLGPIVIMAGSIVLIIGFITPFSEPKFEEPNFDSDDTTIDEESETTEKDTEDKK